MVFISQIKDFYAEYGTLAKIQIDNSLDLGWRREDIILATNFEFEYNGVKSIVVSDDNFVLYCPVNSKFKAILELFERGIFNKDNLYWFHDLDASQAEVITESELAMGEADMALTDYAWRDKWNTGSFFFTSNAKDIFEAIVQTQDLLMLQDEKALMLLTNKFTKEENERLNHSFDSETIKRIPIIKDVERRIKNINTSYNFVPFADIKHCWEVALKPIRVVHFRPHSGFPRRLIPSLLNFYMYGMNDINTVLMPERLIKIYQQHGIK